MECFYFPDLTRQTKIITISGDNAKHFKANHINNENVMVTNGEGLSAITIADRTGKNEFTLQITDYLINYGEEKPNIALGIGILNSRDRFEFALEKSVELGINEFIPLITAHTQKNTTNHNRLLSKSIAAMIQCKRSCLPMISPPLNFEEFLTGSIDYDLIILADPNGEKPKQLNNDGKYLILVGPEGGFSEEEYLLINKIDNLIKWRFGSSRLRAETAAIMAVGFITNLA